MICRSLFFILSFFFWALCCLSFFDIRILITPLVSSTLLGGTSIAVSLFYLNLVVNQ